MSKSLPNIGKGYEFLFLDEEKYPHIGKPKAYNAITGCPNLSRNAEGKVEGCRTPGLRSKSYCYMADLCNRFPDTHKPEYRFHADRLKQPLHTSKPSIVMCGSAGDMWGWLPKYNRDYYIIFEKIEKAKDRFYFLFLTQFPENYWLLRATIEINARFFHNIGIGTTITRSEHIERLQWLNKIDDVMRYVIIEPCFFTSNEARELDFTGIDWIVIGKLNIRNKTLEKRWEPSAETLRILSQEAFTAGCAVFFKDSLLVGGNSDNVMESGYGRLPKEHPRQILDWAKQERTK